MRGNLLLQAGCLALYGYTAVGSCKFRQLPSSPFSGLLVKYHYVDMAKYKGLLISKWGAVAGLELLADNAMGGEGGANARH